MAKANSPFKEPFHSKLFMDFSYVCTIVWTFFKSNLLSITAIVISVLVYCQTERSAKETKTDVSSALDLAKNGVIAAQASAQAAKDLADASKLAVEEIRQSNALEQNALDVQRSSLTEDRRRFEILNASLLQFEFPVGAIQFDLESGGMHITPNLRNLGSYPAELISSMVFFAFTNKVDLRIIDSLARVIPQRQRPIYLSKDSPIPFALSEGFILTKNELNAIINGRLGVAVTGRMRYKDLISGKIREYEYGFLIRLIGSNRNLIEVYKYKNYDI